MSKRDNQLLAQDMLESSLKIKDYVKAYFCEDFINDGKTIDAVVRDYRWSSFKNRPWLSDWTFSNTVEEILTLQFGWGVFLN